jgi:hypothetical protein
MQSRYTRLSKYNTNYTNMNLHLPTINSNLSMNPTNNEKKECPSKPMCLHCGQKTCMMNTSVGLKLVTSSICDRFNKLHIAATKIKGAYNASAQMAPYIICHFIFQYYVRASNLVGFNIVTNVMGCVSIKIRQNFPNKAGFL